MLPYPMLFRPILKPKPWGGRRLEAWGNTLPAGQLIGESWEVSDLGHVEDGRSIIDNGPWAGRTLHDVLASHRNEILGAAPAAADGGFPLLIKLLDATDDLSIQVHPSAAYASEHPDAHLKSEAWYVLEAEPGAVIYKGLQPGVTPEDLRRRIADGTVPDALCAVPVEAGDCHYLPSGTCHALGAGILVAEVQTPSDTTFRLYDWQRTDRQLHIDQALQCINFGPPGASDASKTEPPIITEGMTIHVLARTDHFGMERWDMPTGTNIPVVTNGIPEVWMVLSGRLRLQTSDGTADGTSVDVSRGGTVLIPAAIGPSRAMFDDGSSVLRIALPSPLTGWIA